MNILTNGTHHAQAEVDPMANRLTFIVPSEHEGSRRLSCRRWWGRLERGDRVAQVGPGPRIELLDEGFRSLTHDLRDRALELARSGVVHLRLHGDDRAEILVTRTAYGLRSAGAPPRRERASLLRRRFELLAVTVLGLFVSGGRGERAL